MGILKKNILKKNQKKEQQKTKKLFQEVPTSWQKAQKKNSKKTQKTKQKQKNLKKKHLQKITSPKKNIQSKNQNKNKKKENPIQHLLRSRWLKYIISPRLSLLCIRTKKNDKYPKTKKFSDKTTLTKIYISSHFYIIYM